MCALDSGGDSVQERGVVSRSRSLRGALRTGPWLGVVEVVGRERSAENGRKEWDTRGWKQASEDVLLPSGAEKWSWRNDELRVGVLWVCST